MEEYRKVLPLRMPDKQDREAALGSLIGEKYTLKKTFQALKNSELFYEQKQQGPGEWMFENEVDEQTFPLYTSSFINYAENNRKTIYIIKIECSISEEDFKIVKKSIKAFFQGMKVKFQAQKWKLDKDQLGLFKSEKFGIDVYDSQKFLRQMQNHIPKDAYCILALTDLYFYNTPNEKSLFNCPLRLMENKDPDSYMLFGLASVKDRVGVVNYKRFVDPTASLDLFNESLKEQFEINKKKQEKLNKSLKIDKEIEKLEQNNANQDNQNNQINNEQQLLQYERWQDIPLQQRLEFCNFDENHIISNLVKVVNHEISHMFGIRHCVHYQCIMNGSSYKKFRFDDFKNKPFDLCLVCLRKLQYNLEFDISNRYLKLKSLCDKLGHPFHLNSDLYQNLYDKIQENLKFTKKQ